ncbi:flavodoxin domain-containing protein [Chloroflexota bacterium]
MAKKALIVYGTRFGATADTSEEIASVLRDEGLEVKVVDAKKEKVLDISEYDFIVVGSGIMLDRWTREPEKFLKKFQEELVKKRVALFVSSGAQALIEHEGKFEQFHFGGKTTVLLGAEATGRARKVYLEEKAAKYNLQPIALTVFGGVWDFNHMPWWARKVMVATLPKIEEVGYKEVKPGVYDTRDWDAIRSWAKALVA